MQQQLNWWGDGESSIKARAGIMRAYIPVPEAAMEKILYPMWKAEGQSPDAFRDQLLSELCPRLLALAECEVRGLRLSVADSDVAAAADLRQAHCEAAMDAMLSVWLDSAVYREPVEAAIAAASARMAGYLVTESEPLKTETPEGERTPGMAQVVCLRRPPRLSEAEWLKIWLGSHTAIAIETQSTFGYRQNVIARALTPDASPFDAIVEENFPAEAMTSQWAFYDADNEADYQANLNSMIESCTRFIDFDQINVVPTSEYLIKTV